MLKVEDLCYRYPGAGEDTLRDLTFSIQKGEIFGFLGPSGSGKSTTQKILYKLLTGFRGDIRFQGLELSKWGREFYEQIGVSFELPNHYLKLTALENLQFFGAFYKKKTKDLRALLAAVGLEEDADKPVADFSKGMKMRLNFVRALLHDPEVLFLDEPTSGLDPINAARIKEIIRSLRRQGKTIFLTTHNMFDADQLCDRVALLHRGVIQAIDTPADLKIRFGAKTVRVTVNGNRSEDFVFPLENLGQNEEFRKLLLANDIASIHSQEATLEEVFIKITGQQLS